MIRNLRIPLITIPNNEAFFFLTYAHPFLCGFVYPNFAFICLCLQVCVSFPICCAFLCDIRTHTLSQITNGKKSNSFASF